MLEVAAGGVAIVFVLIALYLLSCLRILNEYEPFVRLPIAKHGTSFVVESMPMKV